MSPTRELLVLPVPYPEPKSPLDRETIERLDRESPATRERLLGRYDRGGKAIGLGTWCHLHENDKYRRVRLTYLSSGYYVSTVWLGLDHNFSGIGPPVIFETMVFRPKVQKDTIEKVGIDLDMDRYATEAEAIVGHEEMVAKFLNFGLRIVKDDDEEHDASELPDWPENMDS